MYATIDLYTSNTPLNFVLHGIVQALEVEVLVVVGSVVEVSCKK